MNLKSCVTLFYLSVIALVVSACSHPVATIAPEGELTILDLSTHRTSLENFNKSWIFRGVVFDRLIEEDLGALQLVPDQAGQALQIKRIKSDFMMVRKSRARLIASPYLSWTWKTYGPLPPFQIVVGFKGGNPQNSKWDLSSLSSSFPDFDRSITIITQKNIAQPTFSAFCIANNVQIQLIPAIKGRYSG